MLKPDLSRKMRSDIMCRKMQEFPRHLSHKTESLPKTFSQHASQIVSAVDGPIVAGDFSDPHTDGACNHEGQCVLLSIWASAGNHMRNYLDSFTLEDIAGMARGEASWPET